MDNGFTPYIAVVVDASVTVPRQFVVDGEIVLNISTDATQHLIMGSDYIDFNARFGGVLQKISVPIDHVLAIYARENGQGMAFPVDREALRATGSSSVGAAETSESLSSAAETAALSLVDVQDGEHGDPREGGETSSRPLPETPAARSGKPVLKRIK